MRKSQFRIEFIMDERDIKSVTFDMFNTLIYPTEPNINYRDLSNMFVKNGHEIHPQDLEGQLTGLVNRKENLIKTDYTDFLLSSLVDVIKIL